jgi:hypothetical protein
VSMKVLCIKIINPTTREEVLEHPGIRLHEEYMVLSITVESKREARLRIMNDESVPVLFDASMFLTVSDRIPKNWTARVDEGGTIEIAPSAWHDSGFWERYFDNDPEALTTFESELQDSSLNW